VIERSSAAISRVLGMRRGVHHGGGHSIEELKLIVSLSRGSGHLPAIQEDMIYRIMDLESLQVRQIMVPRNEMVSIPVDAKLDRSVAHHDRTSAFAAPGVSRATGTDCGDSVFIKICCLYGQPPRPGFPRGAG